MKVLLGEISSYKAIVIGKYIKKNYPLSTVYTYDKKRRTNIIRSRYSDKHFYIDPNFFEEELRELIIKHNINFFFPVINNSLSVLLKNKQQYGKSLNYLGDIKSYNILNNKNRLYNLALEFDIKVPEIYESFEKATTPFVIKPPNLSSAIGVHYIFSDRDKKNSTYQSNTIFQQYVNGRGVGYSFYAKNGKITEGYGHKRLCEYPITGGSSTYRGYYHNNKMHDIASRIIEHLNYTGFAMFEFKLTSDNELYLLEVNPRIWGSINQGLVDGKINYFEGILGESNVKQKNKSKKVRTYIAPLVYISLFKYLFNFQLKPISSFISSFFINKSDVSIFRDPMGYFSTILRKL